VDPLRVEVKLLWVHGGGTLGDRHMRWVGNGMRRPRPWMCGNVAIAADWPSKPDLDSALAQSGPQLIHVPRRP
jgi:hypothetical protein